MTEPIRKYNNRDIRADRQRLSSIAYAYLARYAGNWEVLLTAKHSVVQGHGLSDYTLQVVLNSMLSDPSVRNMPDPIGDTVVFEADQFLSGVLTPASETITLSAPPPPLRIEMKSNINQDNKFWYSVQTNSYLIHIGVGCRVRWCRDAYYRGSRRIPPYHRRFEVKLIAYCKEWGPYPPKNLRSATAEQARELMQFGTRQLCRICVDGWREYNRGYPVPPATGTPEN